MSQNLTAEKLAQAASLLPLSGADVWLVFVRETAEGSDPALPLILDGGLTWQSVLMVSKTGQKVAVVGNYDADPLIHSGDWDKVVPYVQSLKHPLLTELSRLLPNGGKIAVNYSTNDVKSDGLTHGMYLLLQQYLDGHPFELISAEETVMALRARKTPAELSRMRAVIDETNRMFGDIQDFARIGVTERAVYNHVHKLARERGLTFSWDPVGDPIVNSGPDSMIGHGVPSDKITIQPGHIFHIDLGLTKDGYSSDIQRDWYVGENAESEVPNDVTHCLDAVNAAITAGADLLKPGALGHEVDAAARDQIQALGYPEYMHALGHQVGRVAHDGGAILGPQWDRYGNTPNIPVAENEVYTLELGVTLPGRGYLGIEEMVVVTADGCEFMSTRQLTMPLLPS